MKITSAEQTILLTTSGYAATAIISTMPAKDAVWNWRTVYGWAFEALHLMLNLRRPIP